MEVSDFVFRVFCLILTICPVTHYCPFSMILDSFGYLHTLWRCSTKPATKQLACCGGKGICTSCFFCLMLTICSVTYYGLFCTFLPSFRYPHTLLLSIESAFKQWWPFWARICAITKQFTRSVKSCSVNYKNVDRRLQMLDKDYKIPDCGKPSIFVGERQSSALERWKNPWYQG